MPNNIKIMFPYRTLKAFGSDEFIVQKSKFIGYACPASTEEEAKAFISTIKEKHKDATHNCYAYIIGTNAGIMRYSDDGEPSGTAGLPIMDILKQSKIVNCAVVATRYFGGVLLGAGGLIRAYRKACAIGIKAAQIVVMEPTTRVFIEVIYPQWDKLLYNLNNMPVIIEHTDYGANVNISILIKRENLESCLKRISDISDGKVEQIVEDEFYYPWDENITIEE